jgi:hypothetical protein
VLGRLADYAQKIALLVGAMLAGALVGCAPDKPPGGRVTRAPTQELFVDATESSGIRFQHINGRTGEFDYPEIIGSGLALFDFNNDGKLDLLVLQGTPLSTGRQDVVANEPCSARLYRNDLVVNPDGTRNLHFTDVTEASRLCAHGYGMGVAVGDFDNDGCVDVFITHFGASNQLFRNNCDGTFTDVTVKAGVAGDGRWGASATFFDFEPRWPARPLRRKLRRLPPRQKPKCYGGTSARDYCAPSAYKPFRGSSIAIAAMARSRMCRSDPASRARSVQVSASWGST